jgi:hypothetical protein
MDRRSAALLAALLLLTGCAAAVSGESATAQPVSPQQEAPPEAVPAYLRGLLEAERGDFTAADRIALSVRRPDSGLEIADAPPYFKQTAVNLLLALNLSPAAQRQEQALPVLYPAALHFADSQTGAEDVYELSDTGVRVNGLFYAAQNPEALLDDDFLRLDFLNKELLTLGKALGISASEVRAVEWIAASPPSDLPPMLLEGERAVQAAEELLSAILRPREAGDNPATGGSDTYRITLSDSTVREVINFGLVGIDGADPAYFSVWFSVPYTFSY